ncbi:MAG TPA: UDP-phosphate alpha N-acetylglucosaminyltransferase [Ensifer sp.]|nr:UDP-phosphate alpha N-acetylglucosaminyltransferase [Ensifer sp.]
MASLTGTVPPLPVGGRAPVTAREQGESLARAFYILAILAVVGSLLNNTFLCFVNTRMFAVRDSHVMMGELLCITCALIVAFDRKAGLYLSFGVFLAYMLVLFAFRQVFDPKPVRDVLVPFAFYFAGARIASPRLADFLVAFSAILVVAFGLFEYFAVDTFLDYFNVLGYYLARGSLTLTDTLGHTKGLFISGVRAEPRTIFPSLGTHRVSSIFLEPVSTGNFGVIIYAWALFRKEMRVWRWVTFACALTMISLADARFGLYSCIVMTLLRPFFQIIPRTVWFILPFLMLTLLTIYGLASGTHGGPNDISGRLNVTAHLVTQLGLPVVLGAEVTDKFTADSGLAYSLTQFGIGGFVGLWGLFVFAPGKTARAWNFHSMAIIYFLLLMVISNSGYSLKTGGLLWFIVGVANGVWSWDRADQKPAQDLSSSPGPRRLAS